MFLHSLQSRPKGLALTLLNHCQVLPFARSKQQLRTGLIIGNAWPAGEEGSPGCREGSGGGEGAEAIPQPAHIQGLPLPAQQMILPNPPLLYDTGEGSSTGLFWSMLAWALWRAQNPAGGLASKPGSRHDCHQRVSLTMPLMSCCSALMQARPMPEPSAGPQRMSMLPEPKMTIPSSPQLQTSSRARLPR